MDLRPTTEPVPLSRLVALTHAELGDPSRADVTVAGMTVDSRRVQPGDLFAALPGERAHGAEFAVEAALAGAVAALTDAAGRPGVERAGMAALLLDDPRSAVGEVAAEIYGHPAESLLLLGVTGTNGKTTTTWLVEAGLRAAGHRTGLMGTVETRIDGLPVASIRTTPEASELHALLAVMKERGVTAVAIEVSSHALTLGRIDGCLFDVVGFTQFGSDHLDFHPDVEAYFQAKRELFTPRHATTGVVCIDSQGGQRILAEAEIPVTSLATNGVAADWSADQLRPRIKGGYEFRLSGPSEFRVASRTRLPGRFNVANAALALAMLEVAGVASGPAGEGVADCRGVPGRMDSVDEGQDFLAVVDYAHTPDALAAVLTSLRPDTTGQLIVVVGCGGDRYQSKRAVMGEVAAELADVVVVTDDNPRSEDPAVIRAALIEGALRVEPSRRARVLEIAGRGPAIARAVQLARSGDVLVVAGKGHERGQEIAGRLEPFDDHDVLVDTLRVRRNAGTSGEVPETTLQDHRRPEED